MRPRPPVPPSVASRALQLRATRAATHPVDTRDALSPPGPLLLSLNKTFIDLFPTVVTTHDRQGLPPCCLRAQSLAAPGTRGLGDRLAFPPCNPVPGTRQLPWALQPGPGQLLACPPSARARLPQRRLVTPLL